MKRPPILLAALLLATLRLAASPSEVSADDTALRREFANPPSRWQSRPLWFWNGKPDAEKTKGMVAACKAAGYHGKVIGRSKDGVLEFPTETGAAYQINPL